MDLLEKHRKTVNIVAGIAGASLFLAGLYLLFKNKSSNDADYKYTHHHNGLLSKTPDKNSTLVKIKIAYEGEKLALSTVAQIYDGALELASEKYIRLTKHDREARRAVFDDLKKYIELHNAYTNELDQIIEGCQKELLVELGIPNFVWDASMSFYTNQENSVILRLYAGVAHKLKKNLKGSRHLSKNDLKQIMRTEIELFEKEGENIEAIRHFLKNNEEVMSVVHSRVNDQIAKQYEAEEEDIMASMKYHIDDSEVYGLSAQIQRLTGNRLTGY